MTVYVDGRPVVRTSPRYDCWPVQRVWRKRFPRAVVDAALLAAFGRADRYCTPPAGDPFVVNGEPYATSEEFIDSLVEEFATALRNHLAGTRQSSKEVPKVL